MSTTVNRLPELTLTRRGAAKRSRRSLAVKRALLACGIGSSAAYVAANVVGALRGGGYSSVNQSVSELTAIDVPSRPVALPLFVASDVLSLGFGTGVVAAAGRNRPLRVAGWLLVGVGVANMISPFTPMHTREVLAAGGDTWTDPAHLTVVAGTTLQIMGAMGFAAAAFGKGFRNYSVASLVTMLVAGGLTGTQKNAVAANLPTPWNGVYERTSIGVYLLWMSVLAAVAAQPGRRDRGHHRQPLQATPASPLAPGWLPIRARASARCSSRSGVLAEPAGGLVAHLPPRRPGRPELGPLRRDHPRH